MWCGVSLYFHSIITAPSFLQNNTTQDNGAYYYYQTEPGQTYETTLIDVRHYADQAGIPYRYVLLDSWWYYKGTGAGVSRWDAMPSIFPIQSVFLMTPILNPYLCQIIFIKLNWILCMGDIFIAWITWLLMKRTKK